MSSVTSCVLLMRLFISYLFPLHITKPTLVYLETVHFMFLYFTFLLMFHFCVKYRPIFPLITTLKYISYGVLSETTHKSVLFINIISVFNSPHKVKSESESRCYYEIGFIKIQNIFLRVFLYKKMCK